MNLFECIMSYSELLTKRYLNIRLRHPVHFVYFVLDMHFHCIRHARVIEKSLIMTWSLFLTRSIPFSKLDQKIHRMLKKKERENRPKTSACKSTSNKKRSQIVLYIYRIGHYFSELKLFCAGFWTVAFLLLGILNAINKIL